MRQLVAVVAALVVALTLGVVPGSDATYGAANTCDHRSLDTVKIGTGNVGIDLALLNGVNHVDVAYPACSAGRFNMDGSSGNVLWEQHCDEKFLRVYAPAGALGQNFVVNWVASTTCPSS